MAGDWNKAIPQGVLNRMYASVTVANNPALNINSGNLGTEGIRLAFDGNATELLNTMTGMVASPVPYQPCTVTVAIVKSASSNLADIFKQQFAVNTLLGLITVWPDAGNLSSFNLQNMVLENIREMLFNGTEATLVITMRGYYEVNQGFFSEATNFFGLSGF
jgi:hypothetical protein